jgi:hypothetical protein
MTKYNSSDSKCLILDVRSITHLIYMSSVFEDRIFHVNTILIWKGKASTLKLAEKFFTMPKNCYILDINIQDSKLIFNLKAISKIKKLCKKINNKYKYIELSSSFASGFYFELLKHYLGVKDESIIQFDDGLINELKEPNRYRAIKFIIYAIHGMFHFPSRYKLFSDIRFKKIYSSIKPNNIDAIDNKAVHDISHIVSKKISTISLKNISIINSRSAILMTTHSVESDRMTTPEYQKMIKNVFNKLKDNGVTDIYLSSHPAEKNSNNNFYRDLGMNLTFQYYPSELLVANKNITSFASPMNSTILLSHHLKLLDSIELIIAYIPNKSPYVKMVMKLISNILSKYPLTYYVL